MWTPLANWFFLCQRHIHFGYFDIIQAKDNNETKIADILVTQMYRQESNKNAIVLSI